jgi:hypothetical protein
VKSRAINNRDLLLAQLDSRFHCGDATRLLFWRSIVNGEAGCLVCSQARVLKAIFPVAKGYELKFYECANCNSSLWLVTSVTKSSAPKRQRGRPFPGLRFETIDSALKGVAPGTLASKSKGPPA